jgi:hypothetical protein
VGAAPFRPHPVVEDPPSTTLLGQKFLQFPETRRQLHSRMIEIVRNLDLTALHARIDEVARILSTHGSSEKTFRDELFRSVGRVQMKKAQMDSIKNWRPIETPPSLPAQP